MPANIPLSYKERCEQACEWCRAGNERISHFLYGGRHIVHRGDSWDESEHVACAAPSIESYAVELAAELASLREQVKGMMADKDRLDWIGEHWVCISFSGAGHKPDNWIVDDMDQTDHAGSDADLRAAIDKARLVSPWGREKKENE